MRFRRSRPLLPAMAGVLLLSSVTGVASAHTAKASTTTINFAAVKTFGISTWKQVIANFEKVHPEIKVNLIQLPAPSESTTVHQYLVNALQSKPSNIDVLTGDVIWVPEFASAGWLAPMDNAIPKSQYYSGVIKALSYKGHLMAAPWYVDGGMLYYRKDLLKKYNQPVPKTWSQLVTEAKLIVSKAKATHPGLQGFVWQAKQAEVLVCDFVEFEHSNNGDILAANGSPNINSSRVLAATNFMKSLITSHVSPAAVTTYDEEPSRTVFTNGDAVFLRNWSYVWVIAQNPSQSKVAGKVGVAPLPSFPGGHSTATMGGYQFMVAKNSPHVAAATTFAQYLSSAPSQLFFAKTVAFSPTRPAVLKDAKLRAQNPFLIKLRKVFLGVTARPVTPLYPQISLAIQADLSSALSGSMSTSSALSDIQNRMHTICGGGTCTK